MAVESIHARRRFNICGTELGYPTLFQQGSSSLALFMVPSRVANELIADTGFTAAEVAPGRAILSFAGVHYTETQCGAYEEIGCAFFVNNYASRPQMPYLSTWVNILRGRQPSYTWFLPVTQEPALECGKQMWGYPKTIEDIRHRKASGRTVTSLFRDDEEVLRYTVRNGGRKTPRTLSAPVYSNFEGAPHVGYLTQQFSAASYGRDGELVLSDHALVEPLRRLGLPRKPLLSAHMGEQSFSMSAPEPLV